MEKRNGDFLRSLVAAGRVTAAHDLSDGGLAVALAEMTLGRNVGATLDPSAIVGPLPLHALLFGEDQGRYLVTCPAGDAGAVAEAAAAAAGVPLARIGTTEGNALTLPDTPPILIAELRCAHEESLPRLMNASRSG